MEQLLIVVKFLSPLNIDYSKIAFIVATGQSKYVGYGIRILDRVALTHPRVVPRNM
jgi:hypothetical protein